MNFDTANNWKLQIRSAVSRDEGHYECQISTHPPKIRKVYLQVIGEFKYLDRLYFERGRNIKDDTRWLNMKENAVDFSRSLLGTETLLE